MPVDGNAEAERAAKDTSEGQKSAQVNGREEQRRRVERKERPRGVSGTGAPEGREQRRPAHEHVSTQMGE